MHVTVLQDGSLDEDDTCEVTISSDRIIISIANRLPRRATREISTEQHVQEPVVKPTNQLTSKLSRSYTDPHAPDFSTYDNFDDELDAAAEYVERVHLNDSSDSLPVLRGEPPTHKSYITITEACAGISAASQALNELNIPHKHLWMCEKDPHCKDTLKTNYDVGTLYDDFTKLDIDNLESADLFVCGFPCQGFSRSNSSSSNKKGLFHPNNSAIIMKNMMRYINVCNPRCFILENVKAFGEDKNGEYLNKLEHKIRSSGKYHIDHCFLNSLDFGVPQSRERVYIVGILVADLRPAPSRGWEPPLPRSERVHISTILDKNQPECTQSFNKCSKACIERWEAEKGDLYETPYVCELNVSAEYSSCKDGYSPCLLAQHSNAMYLSTERRFLNRNEIYRLQGFPDSFKKHPGKCAWKHQVGNTMTVPVIMALIRSIEEASVIFDR